MFLRQLLVLLMINFIHQLLALYAANVPFKYARKINTTQIY